MGSKRCVVLGDKSGNNLPYYAVYRQLKFKGIYWLYTAIDYRIDRLNLVDFVNSVLNLSCKLRLKVRSGNLTLSTYYLSTVLRINI
jgi:hypothetical protein